MSTKKNRQVKTSAASRNPRLISEPPDNQKETINWNKAGAMFRKIVRNRGAGLKYLCDESNYGEFRSQ